MLVTISTQLERVNLLSLLELPSASVIHAPTVVSPQLDHLLMQTLAINAQAFGASTIANHAADQLLPTILANASVINVATVQKIGGLQWLLESLGQPFVVENRTGAAGNLATEAVVKPSSGC